MQRKPKKYVADVVRELKKFLRSVAGSFAMCATRTCFENGSLFVARKR